MTTLTTAEIATIAVTYGFGQPATGHGKHGVLWFGSNPVQFGQACAELAVTRANTQMKTAIQEAADRLQGLKGGSVSSTIEMLRAALVVPA